MWHATQCSTSTISLWLCSTTQMEVPASTLLAHLSFFLCAHCRRCSPSLVKVAFDVRRGFLDSSSTSTVTFAIWVAAFQPPAGDTLETTLHQLLGQPVATTTDNHHPGNPCWILSPAPSWPSVFTVRWPAFAAARRSPLGLQLPRYSGKTMIINVRFGRSIAEINVETFKRAAINV